MHELGNSGKRMLLPVTGCTILSVSVVVHITVTAGAALIESQKAILPDRQEIRTCVWMAFVTANGQVFSLQIEIEPLVSKAKRIGYACQAKTACIAEFELIAVVFRMAGRAVVCNTLGKISVQTASEE